MMKRRSWRRALAAIAVLAVIAALVLSSPSLRLCISEAHGGAFRLTGIGSLFVADVACFETYLREQAAVLIALFIIILGLSTWFLWFATRDLVDQTEERSHTELRAYMTFHDGKMLITPNGIRFEAVFVNTGKTPAFNVYSIDTCDILAKDARLRPIPEPATRPDSCVVGPGQAFRVGRTQPCTEPTARAVESGQFMGYLWGRLNYIDAFGQPRLLEFARRGGRRSDGSWMLIVTGTDKAN